MRLRNYSLLVVAILMAATMVSCKSTPPTPSQPGNATMVTQGAAYSDPVAQGPAEVRVLLRWRAEAQTVLRIVDHKKVVTDAELEDCLSTSLKRVAESVHGEPTVVIDAAAEVPWNDVVAVIRVCKTLNVQRIDFDFGRTE